MVNDCGELVEWELEGEAEVLGENPPSTNLSTFMYKTAIILIEIY
jgi:hypothetical protein